MNIDKAYQSGSLPHSFGKGLCMKSIRILLLATCLISLGTSLSPKASAGDWDEKSMLTFDQPVELPGIVLPAGTYIFKLIASPVDRNLVQVLSADELKVYGTFNAVPRFRYDTSEKSLIVYEDRTPGSPKAIKEWFYPNYSYGHEFVYSRVEPSQIARTDESEMHPAAESVPAVTDESSYMQALQQRQSGESESIASGVEPAMPSERADYTDLLKEKQPEPMMLARVDEPEKAKASDDMDAVKSSEAHSEMPKTGSILPLIGLSGMLLVTAGAGLRHSYKRAGK
jgi:hypothetical protein